VSKNILPVRGHIDSYYTLSPNTTPPAVVSEMIQSTIQLKEQQHKQEIEEMKQEINQQHKQQMDALTAAITVQFTQQMVAQLADQAALYEERFRSLEGYRVVTSEPEVTTERALQDVGSPAHIIPRSSADRTQGNNILPININ
jgi:ABC-type transporter Mla subunit MlaD